MPESFTPPEFIGSAFPGEPGSLAWHRRRRRARNPSPESNCGRSRSTSPDIPARPSNASQPAQPAARAASPDPIPHPAATQPARPKSRKSRRPKISKDGLKESAEAARLREKRYKADVREYRKRMRRSAAPSPFPRDGATTGPDRSVPDMENEDEPPPSAQTPARTHKRNKAKGKEVIRDAATEEAAISTDRSIIDLDDVPPPSAQQLGKRGRRDTDARSRKKRKTPQSSGLELYGEETIYDTEQEERGGLGGATTQPQSAVDDDYPFGGSPTTSPEEPTVDSRRSHSDSGYAEADGPLPSAWESGMDMEIPHGLPVYKDHLDVATGNSTDEDDADSAMSEASQPPGVPAASDSPPPPPDPAASDDEEDGRAEEPAGAQHDPGLTYTPQELASKNPSPRSSSRRKAKVPFFSRQEEENAMAFAELPQESVVSPPKRRSSKRVQSAVQSEAGPGPSTMARRAKRKKTSDQPDTGSDDEEQEVVEKSQYRSGPLSQQEQNLIIRAVERFRDNEEMTQEEINQVIHDNPQTSTQAIHRQLWAVIQDACPSRPRKKLIVWCRQRFHSFTARGTWTPAQDDELAGLIEKHGKKWKYIAGLINRYDRDVRDRWRNYLVCREAHKTDVWSDGEEGRLRDLVEDSIEKIRQKMRPNSRKSPEQLINWLQISEAMGYTRSRLQCSVKWKRMRAADPVADEVPTVLPPGSSWRLEKARDDLRRITAGDKYTLMSAIRDSGVQKDAKIPWRHLVRGTFRGKYERQALVVTWGRLRKAVPGWEWKTTRDCARDLCEMYETEGGFGALEQSEAEEAQDDDPDGTATSAKRRRRKGKKVLRSAATAISSSPSHSQASDNGEPNMETVESTMAADGVTPAPGDSRPKRGKSRSKTRRVAAASDDEAEPAKQADEDGVMEDQAATHSPGSHTEASPQPSPELDGTSPQPSPSIEAQTARTRKRGRSASVAEQTTAKGKEKETLSAAPNPSSKKSSKRPRRGSLSNAKVDAGGLHRSKKQKVSKAPSSQPPATNHTGESGKSKARRLGKPWSDISSDMNDMEDIPAKLPWSTQ
ncbi:hypothetical protein N658DRAFT_431416 [Parathielavia hyrcaniae]|uniref:Uncharacterized protein n=1 Tax=Parathielavia hyrcaniae TaxID=113614 RepID=A0AAN6PY12_9PEZI|nr:hypothetical protein N658DRAFT_431416 [Parathielavia hyrcaniae]